MDLQWVSEQFENKGININEKEPQDLIEAAVYELKAGWKKD